MPALSLAFFVAGCASLQGDAADAKPAADATEQAEADTRRAAAAVVKLDVDAPGNLKALLEADLDLARLPALARNSALPPRELERLVAAAPAQVRALLETEGYFTPEITVAQVGGSSPPTVRVTVSPGPRARVSDVRIEVRGPLSAGTDLDLPSARPAQQALRNGWALPTGAFFRNEVWSDAKRTALAGLRSKGYVAADWVSTVAQVDAQAHTVALAVVVESGPLYRTGELRVRGLTVQDEATVRNLANFRPGTPATDQLLLDYQERLQKSGLFATASVRLSTNPADPAATPVTVRVTEQQLQDATVGVGISTDVGARGTLEHVHRRVFGLPATARNSFELGTLRRSWNGELSTHTLPGLYRNLVGGAAERIESDTDVVTSLRLRIGRAQETPRIDRLVFAEVERSMRDSALGRERSDALSAHYYGTWRRVDSVLLPTDGQVLTAQLGGGQVRSDPGGSGPFVRAYGRFNVFRPVGRDWFAQGRLEAAQVISRDDVRPPDTQLFRAGGQSSVRGYEYRSLTPTVNGVQTSGKVLFTASAEIARPILARLPQLWGAVFIDAGRAADSWDDLKPAIGTGVGVRFRSPIGPLSLDLAYGHEDKRVRLHLSVGITF